MERLLDVAMFLLLVGIILLVYNGPLVTAFPWLVPWASWYRSLLLSPSGESSRLFSS